MNSHILETEVQEFIHANLKTDINKLLLKGSPFDTIDIKDLVEQIEAKKRCESKLPTWFTCSNIYYPNKLNIEQTSSEITAQQKASLIKGDSIIDLTGGFGVDCFYFSNEFNKVIHCEINTDLSEIVTHNYTKLGKHNIETINQDGLSYLKTSQENFDWIYIDPSRRHDTKGKVFFLRDCLPNVPGALDLLFKHSHNILIKTSPLLDFNIGIQELHFVKSIYVIAVNNEVKELLWHLEDGNQEAITVKTTNIKKKTVEHFNFSYTLEKTTHINFSSPLSYLYEPNATILKAGAFNSISAAFGLNKIHKHSHLYTSDHLVGFPGRRFKIESIIPFNKKTVKMLSITKANITTRNFPETVQQLRKKFKILDGGDVFLFFTTDHHNKKIVIVASKVIELSS